MKRPLLLGIAILFAAGCRAQSVGAKAAATGGTPMPAVFSEPGAIAAFHPHLPAVLDHGICSVEALPAPGVRRLEVDFPDSASTRTSIDLTIDSAGNPLSYTELRGRKLHAPPVSREEVLEHDLTTVYINYVKGTALATNHGGGADSVYLGSAADLQKNATVGDIAARGALVRRICRNLLH